MKKHLTNVIILIIVLATFLRVWKLETHMIFFSDIGKDMLSATQAISTQQLPLLGIESSIPRFKQGPVFIWLMMICFVLLPNQPLLVGFVVVAINVIAIIFLYELLILKTNKSTALAASLILAASPLAVAQSRMPYHIAPMIFALVVHLWAVAYLDIKKPQSVLFACLSWAFVFQFELAFFPTVLILAIKLWPAVRKNKNLIIPIVGGFTLGLLPQLIFDFTHRFTQLGGFIAWVGYRMVSFVGIMGPHVASVGSFKITITQFSLYLTRIFSVDTPIVAAVFVTATIFSCFHIVKRWKNTPAIIQYAFGLFAILTAGYVVHSSPSEAYFPPFILLLPVLIGWGVSRLGSLQKVAGALLVVWALFAAHQIIQNNFFVQPTVTAFNYGASYKDVRNIIKFIGQNAEKRPFRIASTDTDAVFESYLDNYKIAGRSLAITTNDDATLTYYINKRNSDLLQYPNATVFPFGSIEVVKVIHRPEAPEENE